MALDPDLQDKLARIRKVNDGERNHPKKDDSDAVMAGVELAAEAVQALRDIAQQARHLSYLLPK